MDAKRPFSGFKEVPHQADIALDVYAPSLPELFINAAKGLYHILGIRKGTTDPEKVHISLVDNDLEGLLVAFLNELLFQSEKGCAAETFQVKISALQLDAALSVVSVLARQREIKAVTYHNLKIEEKDQTYSARIVFDL